mgnify:CR=1 FL=1
MHISRNSGIRQVDLAELLEIKPITLARLIDQLADVGLVERCVDPSDRRAYQIFLTAAAPPHLEAIKQVGKNIQDDALRDVDAQQIATLILTLNKMRDNLSQR